MDWSPFSGGIRLTSDELTPPSPRSPVLVLGIGNILLRDEGIGVRVVEAMWNLKLPDGVELQDGGTAGFGLMDVLADRRKVVVIDAAEAPGAPGSVLRFTRADLPDPDRSSTSLHDIGLTEALAAVELLGCGPSEVVLVGVVPKTIEPGLELSEEVSSAIPKVIQLVLAELES